MDSNNIKDTALEITESAELVEENAQPEKADGKGAEFFESPNFSRPLINRISAFPFMYS